MKVLWIQPTLNHYKGRQLERLAELGNLDLTVLSGKIPIESGARAANLDGNFKVIEVNAVKTKWHTHPALYITLIKWVKSTVEGIVLIPAERRHMVLLLLACFLRRLYRIKIVSYNHPVIGGRTPKTAAKRHLWLTKMLFAMYDGIIFYTRQAEEFAVSSRLINCENAYFANNTLDTTTIWESTRFSVNHEPPLTLLFIGRLLTNKKIDVLFEYFYKIRETIQNARLIIIGDGFEAKKVEKIASLDKRVIWRKAVVDERDISRDMAMSHIVFVPGHSGLSIVHSFCYGKPYATIDAPTHAPEISYLEDEKNGLLLKGNAELDCERLIGLWNDNQRYEKMCIQAYERGKKLSIDAWCNRILNALKEVEG